MQCLSCTDPGVDQTGKPAGYDFPHGLVDFRANGGSAGGTIQVSMTYPTAIPNGSKCYKVDSEGFFEIDCDIFGATVRYYVTDGEAGDSDNTADGIICDPVGVASPSVTAGSVSGGNGGSCFISAIN